MLIRHPRHVRFYRSVTIVTGGFRTAILQRRARHRDRNQIESEKSDDNAITYIYLLEQDENYAINAHNIERMSVRQKGVKGGCQCAQECDRPFQERNFMFMVKSR